MWLVARPGLRWILLTAAVVFAGSSLAQTPTVPDPDADLSSPDVRKQFIALADQAVAPLAERLAGMDAGSAEAREAWKLLRQVVVQNRGVESLERRLATALAAQHQAATDVAVQCDYLYLMSELQTAKVLQYYRSRLSHPDYALTAIRGLARCPNPDATDVLEEGLARDTLRLQAEYLRALGERHDPQATDTVLEFLRARDGVVRREAVLALGQLPSAAALRGLVPDARNIDDGFALPALRSLVSATEYLRRVGKGEEARKVHREILAAEDNPKPLVGIVWKILATVAAPDDLVLVQEKFADAEPAVQLAMSEAVRTILEQHPWSALPTVSLGTIALVREPLAPSHPDRLLLDSAYRFVSRAFDPSTEAEGVVPGWWICRVAKADREGLIAVARDSASSVGDQVETRDGSSRWLFHPVDPGGRIELSDLGQRRGVAIARIDVQVEDETPAVLELWTDEGFTVWLGAEEQMTSEEKRNADVPVRVPIALRRGWNTLLLEIPQRSGDWAFSARLVGVTGAPLTYRWR